ncbi:hypothetical protein [Micromonospora echinospora]
MTYGGGWSDRTAHGWPPGCRWVDPDSIDHRLLHDWLAAGD